MGIDPLCNDHKPGGVGQSGGDENKKDERTHFCPLCFGIVFQCFKDARVELEYKASLAQLEERGSHNPKVVSSILTTRSFFFSTNTPLHIQLPPLLIYFSLDVPVAWRVLH